MDADRPPVPLPWEYPRSRSLQPHRPQHYGHRKTTPPSLHTVPPFVVHIDTELPWMSLVVSENVLLFPERDGLRGAEFSFPLRRERWTFSFEQRTQTFAQSLLRHSLLCGHVSVGIRQPFPTAQAPSHRSTSILKEQKYFSTRLHWQQPSSSALGWRRLLLINCCMRQARRYTPQQELLGVTGNAASGPAPRQAQPGLKR